MTADDVGVPRADIVSIGAAAAYEAVVKTFRDSSHTRLPVTGRDLDDVKGVLLLKDLLTVVGEPAAFSMARLMRPVTVVPETMSLPRVLQTMKKSRAQMVIVTDEFGGTSRLLTLNDILGELVGDLDSETTDDGPAPLTPLGNGKWRVRGDYQLEDLDSQVGTSLNELFGDDVETLAGAVMRVAKTVPGRGESFRLAPGVEATITATDGRRILTVDLSVAGARA
jgi:magnesium and cobalt transporter